MKTNKDLIDKIILKIGMVNLFMEKSLSRKDEQKKIYPSIEKIKETLNFHQNIRLKKV